MSSSIPVSGRGIFFTEASIPAVELTEPSVRCVLEVHFPASKRSGREAEYSLPYSDVMSEWSCTSRPPPMSPRHAQG